LTDTDKESSTGK